MLRGGATSPVCPTSVIAPLLFPCGVRSIRRQNENEAAGHPPGHGSEAAMHYEALKQVWGALIAPGAPFEVETIEVAGVPIRGFKKAAPNVRALWLSTAAFGDRDYLVYQDERITYAEAHRRVAAIANWLLAEGVKP